MDADLAALPTPQSSSNVPYDIYLPLLQIARIGYDANDVRSWYATIQDQLLHDTYAVSTSESNSIAPVPSLDGTISTAADASITERDFGVGYTEHSHAHLGLPDSFSYEAYASSDVPAASPLSAPSTYAASTPGYETTSNFDYHHSPSPYPQRASMPAMTPGMSSTPAYSPAQFPAQMNVWPHSQRSNDNEAPLERSTSHSPRYGIGTSNTPMPLLVPSTDYSPPVPGSSGPIYTSTEVMYLPPIAIIPSRKRRKAGSKGGVKKFIQPLHVSRQSI